MEINGTSPGSTYDSILVTDASGVTYGGSLQLACGTTFADNTTFDLFGVPGTSFATFVSVTAAGSYSALTFTNSAGVWIAHSGSLTLSFVESTENVIVVPEPSVVAVLGCGAAAFLAGLRRRIG